MNTNRIINTGIIGFGMAGKIFHAPFIQHLPGFNLAKISTANPDSIAYAKALYPATTVIPDASAIIKDKSIELVIIVTPNEAHFPLAKAALEEGKHVIVDKPFTITTAEADELIALAKKQKRILTVYHNRRYVSDYKTVKTLLNSGLLGNLTEYYSALNRFRPQLKENAWREEALPGSGILYDLGSHLIDQALQLFGLPEEVTATIQLQRPGAKADDYFLLTLKYPNLLVYLHSGMIKRIPGPVFVLHGNKGSFVKSGMDIQEAALASGQIPTAPDWGREPKEIWGTLLTETKGLTCSSVIESEAGCFQDYFLNIHHAITENGTLDVKPEQSRNVIKIIELAFQSQQEKRTITTVPEMFLENG